MRISNMMTFSNNKPKGDEPPSATAAESNITTTTAPYNDVSIRSGTAAFVKYPKGRGATVSYRNQIQQDAVHQHLFFPWNRYYKLWWGFTVGCAIFTGFLEPYAVAFEPAGLEPYNDGTSVLEYILVAIFVLDMAVTFNLAYYDAKDEVVYERSQIAKHYLYESRMLWIDLIGVFPFTAIALASAGELGQDSKLAQYLSLFRLLRLVRMHRLKQLLDALQYSTRLSLMWLTLTRNFGTALLWTHWSACIFYFIAKQYSFDSDETWIGGRDNNGSERYLTALYWSIVTFTTVGYGDFSPVNSAEQIWGMIYMLLNMILMAWIIGSITLLIVKNDEQTGAYRDTLQKLDQYSSMHSFDTTLKRRLKRHLKLDFHNSEFSDEQVLSYFPSSVRRKVLRRLYMPYLIETSLMKGIRQQFIDAFLTSCTVEIFSPGEDLLERGSVSSDLYLLVGGVVELLPLYGKGSGSGILEPTNTTTGSKGAYGGTSTAADSERLPQGSASAATQLAAGDFINEVSFFTESPQIDTLRTVTVCKTLTMSRSAYKAIGEDHPASVGKILYNLLAKVETIAADVGGGGGSAANSTVVDLPVGVSRLRAGSSFYDDSVKNNNNVTSSSYAADVHQTVTSVQNRASLTAIKDLVEMHISKQKDDHTMKFLFAASRGCTSTVSLMCDQGFDPNNSDYDRRTALMVASLKGNSEVVTKLLEYDANPNLVDVHGSSALYEAAKNGHEPTMGVLLSHDATLCMDESQAASTLCQAVFDGDILLLRRLLEAKIDVNAADYDKRTAAHIAAAEGNLVALRVLVDFDADLTRKDRWDSSIKDEAKRASNADQLLEYLGTLKKGDET